MNFLPHTLRREAFDTVRPWMDRLGWTEDRIDAMDQLLDRLRVERAPIIVTGNRPISGRVCWNRSTQDRRCFEGRKT